MNIDLKQKIDSLKASISIQSMFERDGHKLLRVGGLLKCRCPFHSERSPSCVIYPDHYFCFGCNSNGTIFDYVMRRDGVDFKGALESLSGSAGIPVDQNKPQPLPPKRIEEPVFPEEYFTEKIKRWQRGTCGDDLTMLSDSLGVPWEPLVSLDFCWAEDHSAWAIPMRNAERRMVGIRLRSEDGQKWAVKGSKQGLFIPTNHKPQGDLAVTEGPTDCAAVLSMGLYAIGKPAAMSGTEEITKFVEKHRFHRVIVIADNDDTGMKGADKFIASSTVPTCRLLLPTKDVREFARMGGSRLVLDSMLQSQNWRMTQ